jgi:3-oxoacyl-[acyl-carrier-protein] synthase III
LAHQVGRAVDNALMKEVGVEESKCFNIYEEYGNQASAALPLSLILASEQQRFSAGERILLMGFGSGLNVTATGVEW